jgi:hypothetical protein
MKYIERIIPRKEKEYGGWVYVGENGDYILAMSVNREGVVSSIVHALDKNVWKVKVLTT